MWAALIYGIAAEQAILQQVREEQQKAERLEDIRFREKLEQEPNPLIRQLMVNDRNAQKRHREMVAAMERQRCEYEEQLRKVRNQSAPASPYSACSSGCPSSVPQSPGFDASAFGLGTAFGSEL